MATILKKAFPNALQWRHNGHDSVSNHQPHDCLLNRLFRRRSKKTSKHRVTGLCAGNSPGTGEFPAQMASDAEYVSIWWRHHGVVYMNVALFGFKFHWNLFPMVLLAVIQYQATSHYLILWWPRLLTDIGITRPQWFSIQKTIMCWEKLFIHSTVAWYRYALPFVFNVAIVVLFPY